MTPEEFAKVEREVAEIMREDADEAWRELAQAIMHAPKLFSLQSLPEFPPLRCPFIYREDA